MSYDHKPILDFIENVNKEAEQAAQEVFNKNRAELLKMIQEQLKEGDEVNTTSNIALLTKINGDILVGRSLAITIQSTYYYPTIKASFSLPTNFTKDTKLDENKI